MPGKRLSGDSHGGGESTLRRRLSEVGHGDARRNQGEKGKLRETKGTDRCPEAQILLCFFLSLTGEDSLESQLRKMSAESFVPGGLSNNQVDVVG